MTLRLAVLDLAGTTVCDDGLVLDAVLAALGAVRVPCAGPRFPALRRQAEATMDRASLAVFGDLLDGDMHRARHADSAFAARLRSQVRAGVLREIPGATAAMTALHDAGLSVCLCSGFEPALHAEMVEALGWTELADLLVCPADVDGRGLPDPAMLLTAAARAEVEPSGVVTAGDATSAMTAGRRAGAGLTVGVLTGAHRAAPLRAAGADAIVDSVADLPALLGLPS
ncbi:Haloacid dehalogenase domain protein hydrolase [Pseudonocardia dioxanivorans CB1190]|uniref:Haloacid dehalogenase domain protein hydrolase n=1 Tax=Pseudonocardia dioxanivorans (strain ATCC 55486 / DSM 44775 / JCM 13855 / CB1190) TaxID=675635 RepID=F4CPN0_PSEUX|nr:HAD family hydrolase [Pseudonocardia dioxanivorans]AEA25147.1 Haloacid dehalogenase domain protein hydrolase [Pseudonocardia dioxanivorans CB1190]